LNTQKTLTGTVTGDANSVVRNTMKPIHDTRYTIQDRILSPDYYHMTNQPIRLPEDQWAEYQNPGYQIGKTGNVRVNSAIQTFALRNKLPTQSTSIINVKTRPLQPPSERITQQKRNDVVLNIRAFFVQRG
jgi:hypothetical protein